MSNKSYRSAADIRKMADRSKPVVDRLEYTSEEDVHKAHKEIHEKMFSKPAETCELCGYPMDYNGHQPTEWETKWSTHSVCRDKLHSRLDRETGITRERRMFGRAKPKDKKNRN